ATRATYLVRVTSVMSEDVLMRQALQSAAR
ncbi:MAG: hypothetical protein ACI9K9_001428, partial [Neolewinella sp.]